MVKKVSVKGCVWAIVFSIVALLLVALVPYVLGAVDGNSFKLFGDMQFAFSKMPIIGDGQMVDGWGIAIAGLNGIGTMLGMVIVDEMATEILNILANFGVITFAGIIVLDIVLALLLAIIRKNGFRKFCRFLSILLGIVMCVIFAMFLIYTIGLICASIFAYDQLVLVPTTILDSLLITFFYYGGIWAIVGTILSALMISKQFKWFREAY